MKEHILCCFSDQFPKQLSPYTTYDFLSQISYLDAQHTKKVIDFFPSHGKNSTFETSTIETSDKDDYVDRMFSTTLTENVENSDVDNFHLCNSTMETRSTEICDTDNLWKMLSTTTTFTVENSDKDS